MNSTLVVKTLPLSNLLQAISLSSVAPDDDEKENDDTDENDKIQEKMVFLQYRVRVTDKFKYALMKFELPIKVI